MTDHDPRRPRDEAELLALIHAIDEPAPERLHARVQALLEDPAREAARSRGRSPRWRLGWMATAVAAVAAALTLALALPGSSGPSLSQATALTLRGPSMRAPAENAGNRTTLTAAVEGIAFPYWEHRFGWRASGQRIDSLDGRTIRTVFYTNAAGRRIGYAIVAGRPAPAIATGTARWRGGTRYQLTTEHGVPVVIWQRDGHLCIVSGRGVGASTLLALASWDEQRTLS